MFYLQDLFDELGYGELQELAIGKYLPDSDLMREYPGILTLINSGLTDLYSRFKIKEKEFDLHQRAGKSLYYLRAGHVGDPLAGDAEIYIDGTGNDPVDGDIIRLLEAYDADGNEVHINSPQFPLDIFTPEVDIIKVALPDSQEALKVISLIYQASYPKIVIGDDPDPEAFALYFPLFLKKALRLYIAGSMFVGKASNAQEKGNLSSSFLYQYELECTKIESLGLVPQRGNSRANFESTGWV